MKTSLKQFAAGTLFTLLLLAGNVKADGTEIKASGHETIETTLQLENWMTNETIWNTNTFNAGDFVLETEAELELESWMTNENMWDLSMNLDIESEASIELEDWMTNEDIWNLEATVAEEVLTLENWMTDSKIWK